MNATFAKLVDRQLIDRYVAPCRSIKWSTEVREVLALPRQIMVMKEGAASLESLVEDVARRDIQRKRREVLHDHHVDAGERLVKFVERRRLEGVEGETRQKHVARTFARDRDDAVAELFERSLPLGGLNGDTVSAPEAETDERELSHGPRLGAKTQQLNG